ncbi:MAG: hypothetical protein WA162_04440 [Thermodesulfobacteriota bacterium]
MMTTEGPVAAYDSSVKVSADITSNTISAQTLSNINISSAKLYYAVTAYTTLTPPAAFASYAEVSMYKTSDDSSCSGFNSLTNCYAAIPAEIGQRVWYFIRAIDVDGNFDADPEPVVKSGALVANTYVYDKDPCLDTPAVPVGGVIIGVGDTGGNVTVTWTAAGAGLDRAGYYIYEEYSDDRGATWTLNAIPVATATPGTATSATFLTSGGAGRWFRYHVSAYDNCSTPKVSAQTSSIYPAGDSSAVIKGTCTAAPGAITVGGTLSGTWINTISWAMNDAAKDINTYTIYSRNAGVFSASTNLNYVSVATVTLATSGLTCTVTAGACAIAGGIVTVTAPANTWNWESNFWSVRATDYCAMSGNRANEWGGYCLNTPNSPTGGTITSGMHDTGGNVGITWTAPALNTDATPLIDLVGHYVYEETSDNRGGAWTLNLTPVATVTPGTITTAVVATTGAAGRWSRYHVSAYDSCSTPQVSAKLGPILPVPAVIPQAVIKGTGTAAPAAISVNTVTSTTNLFGGVKYVSAISWDMNDAAKDIYTYAIYSRNAGVFSASTNLNYVSVATVTLNTAGTTCTVVPATPCVIVGTTLTVTAPANTWNWDSNFWSVRATDYYGLTGDRGNEWGGYCLNTPNSPTLGSLSGLTGGMGDTGGTVNVLWTAPSFNTDVTSLIDLAGHYVYEETSDNRGALWTLNATPVATITPGATTNATVGTSGGAGRWSRYHVSAYDSCSTPKVSTRLGPIQPGVAPLAVIKGSCDANPAAITVSGIWNDPPPPGGTRYVQTISWSMNDTAKDITTYTIYSRAAGVFSASTNLSYVSVATVTFTTTAGTACTVTAGACAIAGGIITVTPPADTWNWDSNFWSVRATDYCALTGNRANEWGGYCLNTPNPPTLGSLNGLTGGMGDTGGTVGVLWTAPTLNTDATSLLDLVGHYVYDEYSDDRGATWTLDPAPVATITPGTTTNAIVAASGLTGRWSRYHVSAYDSCPTAPKVSARLGPIQPGVAPQAVIKGSCTTVPGAPIWNTLYLCKPQAIPTDREATLPLTSANDLATVNLYHCPGGVCTVPPTLIQSFTLPSNPWTLAGGGVYGFDIPAPYGCGDWYTISVVDFCGNEGAMSTAW